MSFLTQTLKALSAMRPAHSFWPIWIVITAAAAIFVVVGVRPVAASRSANAAKHPINLMPSWRQVAAPGAVAALTFLAIFLVFYIAMTLAWEDFTYYDNSDFTYVTLQGHDLIIQATPASGRFFPLAFQEYNIIRHFTNTITGYHVLSIVQLLILSCILLVFDTELSIAARAALAILALLTPSILFTFNALILPERNIVFFLACLMLSVRQFEQTRSIAWALAAAVSVQFMIYYKETTFLLVLGFAAGRLLLRCRNAPGPGWDYKRLWDREGRLDLCLAALAVLFLLYYMARLVFYHYVGGQGIYGNTNYAAKFGAPLAQVVLAYARVDLLALLLVAVLLGRSYLIVRNRTAPSLLWDGLAFGGVVCLLAYLRLGMFGMYYLAPVDLIAVLYVGRFAVLSWPRMRAWSKAAALVFTFTVLVQTVAASAYVLFEEKNLIHAKAEIASVVEARYRSGGGTVLSLFFPFASPLGDRRICLVPELSRGPRGRSRG